MCEDRYVQLQTYGFSTETKKSYYNFANFFSLFTFFGQDTYFYYFTSIQRKNKWTQIIINSLKHRHSDKEIKLVEQKIIISLILQIIQIDGDANHNNMAL